MTIGLIGLGNMGSRIARHLLATGRQLVVYNRTRARAERLRPHGARVADTPRALTRSVDIVLSCVSDGSASRRVFLGSDGVVAAARAGQILINHATVGPECTSRIRCAARRHGARFLDAPLSGGPEGASKGSLTVMVGGDEDEFAAALPVLRRIGRRVVYMGPSGSGTMAKLVNQMLVGIHSQAACEALLVGMRYGLEPASLAAVLMDSWGASRMLERNAALISSGRLGPSAAPLRNLLKDLELGVRTAAAAKVDVPLAGQALDGCRKAAELGWGERDFTVLCDLLAGSAKVGSADSDSPGRPAER